MIRPVSADRPKRGSDSSSSVASTHRVPHMWTLCSLAADPITTVPSKRWPQIHLRIVHTHRSPKPGQGVDNSDRREQPRASGGEDSSVAMAGGPARRDDSEASPESERGVAGRSARFSCALLCCGVLSRLRAGRGDARALRGGGGEVRGGSKGEMVRGEAQWGFAPTGERGGVGGGGGPGMDPVEESERARSRAREDGAEDGRAVRSWWTEATEEEDEERRRDVDIGSRLEI
ncbi:hypothetical protein Mp_3g00400 [Marchantia polymorpha subsp. ruderalis]|uniref:Uncharacterized protein n=2 Tax=Marchantia polymorpha TaxID=3197 RepID=A0AAF6AVV9_MARPO|nr:hypothetical protein MARPO_0007s0037 [Marchantia polymorpha]BBN03893.1 hypothetical protein Mp_3g00400 [Marchantia polymorpha subsp. ruderalis]|eukprot:PTQ47582.1 hypothetical protein MARPO_0007s0037 [Marchantia polymorpha]